MQITAGHLRGRSLISPASGAIRPTASRTREAMFNLLLHAPPPPGLSSAIVGQRVADICCGSGLLGFEALSRGAAHATFVDRDKAALTLAEANARHLGVAEATRFLLADGGALPPMPAPCAAIFADPPYGKGLAEPLIGSILSGGWLMPGGYLALELAASDPEPQAEGLILYRDRVYGKARLRVYGRKDTL